MTPDEPRGDRSPRNAVALAAAIAELGIECALEVRGGLALLLPTQDSVIALQDDETRRAVLALAKEHGFTHVAIELPSERRKSSTPPTDARLLRELVGDLDDALAVVSHLPRPPVPRGRVL